MGNAIWPLTLPQVLQQDGFSSQPPNNIIAQPMDVGPRKTRRRDVVATYPVQGQIIVSKAQLAALWVFYRVTLADGALPFDWTEPTTGNPATFMFKEPYSIADIGGGNARVTMSLEVQA